MINSSLKHISMKTRDNTLCLGERRCSFGRFLGRFAGRIRKKRPAA
jgi:hypothetical protein